MNSLAVRAPYYLVLWINTGRRSQINPEPMAEATRNYMKHADFVEKYSRWMPYLLTPAELVEKCSPFLFLPDGDPKVGGWSESRLTPHACDQGSRLARALIVHRDDAGESWWNWYSGVDRAARLLGVWGAQLEQALRICGAGDYPLGSDEWKETPEVVWGRFAKLEKLPTLREAEEALRGRMLRVGWKVDKNQPQMLWDSLRPCGALRVGGVAEELRRGAERAATRLSLASGWIIGPGGSGAEPSAAETERGVNAALDYTMTEMDTAISELAAGEGFPGDDSWKEPFAHAFAGGCERTPRRAEDRLGWVASVMTHFDGKFQVEQDHYLAAARADREAATKKGGGLLRGAALTTGVALDDQHEIER